MRPSARILSISVCAFLLGIALGGAGVIAAVRGSAVFSDVPEGSYYDEAVGEMYATGIIKGYSNGNFGPNDFVTRAQVAVMMQRLRDDLQGGSHASSSSTQSSSTSSSSFSSSSSSVSSASSSVASSNNGAFRFTSSTFSIPETIPTMTISVQRTGGSVSDVSVKVSARGGTAAAGADFVELTNQVLNFPDGVTSKTFTLSIKDDILAEGPETVILELSDPTGGAVIGSPGSATLTLLDNEASNGSASSSSSSSSTSQAAGAGTLGFSALAYEALENAGNITVTVARTGGSTGQVSVSYATSDKTAKAGAEYGTTNGTLTFATGETSKTFTVALIDDTAVDGKKTLTLTLSAPTGGAGLSTATATLGIADDESAGSFGSGTLMFSKSTYQATEGDGIATLTVNRVSGTLHTVSVSYAAVSGTALPGQDYTNTSGTLTFQPGEQSKTFTVPVIRDSVSDSGEYFTVNLSAPTGGAVVDSPSSVLVYIYE